MELACELTVGYVQKMLIFKKQHITLLLFRGQDGVSSHRRRTQNGNGVAKGVQGWGGSRVTEVAHGGSCRALWEGSRGFGGAAYFLTAYFFVCFIQLLQRVQQFLWGENVRGSWEGREDSELTHLW